MNDYIVIAERVGTDGWTVIQAKSIKEIPKKLEALGIKIEYDVDMVFQIRSDSQIDIKAFFSVFYDAEKDDEDNPNFDKEEVFCQVCSNQLGEKNV